jgi:hypothetical protein
MILADNIPTGFGEKSMLKRRLGDPTKKLVPFLQASRVAKHGENCKIGFTNTSSLFKVKRKLFGSAQLLCMTCSLRLHTAISIIGMTQQQSASVSTARPAMTPFVMGQCKKSAIALDVRGSRSIVADVV